MYPGLSLVMVASGLWAGFCCFRYWLPWVLPISAGAMFFLDTCLTEGRVFSWTQDAGSFLLEISVQHQGVAESIQVLCGMVLLFGFRYFASAKPSPDSTFWALERNQLVESPATAITEIAKVADSPSKRHRQTGTSGQGYVVALLKKYGWPGAAAFLLIFCLWWVRGSESARFFFRSVLVVSAILLPFSCFLPYVHAVFERHWIAGVRETRASTIRQILGRTMIRYSTILIVMFALLMIVIPANPELIVSEICILILSAGMGGVVIWLAVRFYRFWARETSQAFLLLAVAVGTVCLTGVMCTVSGDHVVPYLNRTGLIPALLYSIVSSVVIWVCVFVDLPRRLGAESAFPECADA